MERFCSKCGTLVTGSGAFCPQCGAPLESAVDLNKPEPAPTSQPVYSQPVNPQPSQPMYSQPVQNYNVNQGAMPNYPQNYNAQPTSMNSASEEMTAGNWALTIFLTSALGIVSWILLFVWGFSSTTPQPKKNYCRGMLIWTAISIGLVILFYIGMIACIGGAAGGLSDIFDEMYY